MAAYTEYNYSSEDSNDHFFKSNDVRILERLHIEQQQEMELTKDVNGNPCIHPKSAIPPNAQEEEKKEVKEQPPGQMTSDIPKGEV